MGRNAEFDSDGTFRGMTQNSSKTSLAEALTRSENTIGGPVMVAKAQLIAALAHAGQTDAIGAPYNGHLSRVVYRAESIRGRMTGSELDRFEVEATAWLHDVLEDTSVSFDELRIAGFPPSVCTAVSLLTHRGEPRIEYLERIAADPFAPLVKTADTIDNPDPVRLRAVTDPVRRARLATKYNGQMDLLLAASEGTIDRSLVTHG